MKSQKSLSILKWVQQYTQTSNIIPVLNIEERWIWIKPNSFFRLVIWLVWYYHQQSWNGHEIWLIILIILCISFPQYVMLNW